jgi:predicted amidohydrolase
MDQITENRIRIGVVQTGSVPGDPAENLSILRQFSQQAKEAGCAAVCFPEGFLTGYDPGQAEAWAIASDDPALRAVSEIHP